MPENAIPEDPEAPSQEYLALKSRLDAWEMWEDLTPLERLDQLLDTFSAESWVEPAHLNVFTVFYHDPQQWLRITTRAKTLGVNTYHLERAVKDILARHAKAKQAEQNGAALAVALTPEAQLNALLLTSDPQTWYASLALLATVRMQADTWFLVTETAKRSRINAINLERAVDEIINQQRNTARKTTPPTTAPLGIQSHEEALRTLTEEWGIPIVACLRHGVENATWHLHLAGGQEVNIGTSKNLLNEADTRAAIFDATGKAIRHYGRKEQETWRALVEMIAAIAVTIDTPELSRKGYILGLLHQYLDYQRCVLTRDASEEEWQALALAKKPFVQAGALYLNAPSVHQFCHALTPELTRAGLLDLLRHIGGVTIKVNCWGEGAHATRACTSRAYWKIALTALIEQAPALEMPEGNDWVVGVVESTEKPTTYMMNNINELGGG